MPVHPGLTDRPAGPAPEMIPRTLLLGMAALALASVLLVAFAAITHRPKEGVPAQGQPVAQRSFILEGRTAQAVTVMDVDGTVLLDLPHGGFITVVQSALARERVVARVPGNPPVTVTRYDNGRLVAEDPATGWSVELYAFGEDNLAAFERLFNRN